MELIRAKQFSRFYRLDNVFSNQYGVSCIEPGAWCVKGTHICEMLTDLVDEVVVGRRDTIACLGWTASRERTVLKNVLKSEKWGWSSECVRSVRQGERNRDYDVGREWTRLGRGAWRWRRIEMEALWRRGGGATWYGTVDGAVGHVSVSGRFQPRFGWGCFWLCERIFSIFLVR